MKTGKSPYNTIRLLENISFGSGVFALVLCVLIIVNFIQIKRADPLNTTTMTALVEKLQNNPENGQVRQEIRTLDLLARKAFFTTQWQVRTGGYLLFISILILISSIKIIELIRIKLPEEPQGKPVMFWEIRIHKRKWLMYSGAGMVVLTLLLAWLTHNEMGKDLQFAMSPLTGSRIQDAGSPNPHPESSIPHPASGIRDSATVIRDSASGIQSPASSYPSWQEIRSNFPSFRGPGGIGITERNSIPTSWDARSGKNVKWKTYIPLPGYNSPVIWNDRIFLSGASETKREVYCLDAVTGKMLWKTPVEKIPGSPSQAPGVSKETGQAAPSLTTDGRRVYAIFANGDLIALDMDGKPVWSKNLGVPANHYGHSSSLIMYRDVLIIQFDQRGGAAVMGLSGKTGEQVWKTSRNVKISWASPSLINTGNRMELVLSAEPCVAAYDPLSGKELWKLDCISGEVGPSLAYANGIVFSVNEYSTLSAVRIGETPKVLWENNEFLSDVPSPVATDKYLFLVTSYGTAVCYDAVSGTKYWEHDFGNPVYSSPMLAEGRIYLMDKKGMMFIFKAGKEFSPVSECPLGEGSFCTPAFTTGHIFLRGDKNLYCIGK
ncbi:MAG: PQQ-binding-like beta-propeller repeat protein [Bacteroidetes bacterium]|nr:PQQ-binding-like beta-propeller repeat protein [Bacteroidota bacterium]